MNCGPRNFQKNESPNFQILPLIYNLIYNVFFSNNLPLKLTNRAGPWDVWSRVFKTSIDAFGASVVAVSAVDVVVEVSQL